MQRNHKRSIIYSTNIDIVDALCLFLSVMGARPRPLDELSAGTDEVWKAVDGGVAKDNNATVVAVEFAVSSTADAARRL